MKSLTEPLPEEEIVKRLVEDSYNFILHDTRVPDIVTGGVSKFIDFRNIKVVLKSTT